MGDAAEGRRGAAYVFRNTNWLLTLRVNAQPSGKNSLILCAKYHSQAMNPQCSCLRAKAAQVSGHLPAEFPGVQVLALDAADEGAPAKVFETLLPDILVVCAGALPYMAPLVEQRWEQFSRNWNSDVKMSLLFSQAALTTPLPAGTTIMLISSGAALGGSSLSGGYAGAKRTQMFLADYAQKESAPREEDEHPCVVVWHMRTSALLMMERLATAL